MGYSITKTCCVKKRLWAVYRMLKHFLLIHSQKSYTYLLNLIRVFKAFSNNRIKYILN